MLRRLVLHMLLLLLVLLLLQNMKKFAQKARKQMLLFEELLMGSVQTLHAIAPQITIHSNVLSNVQSLHAPPKTSRTRRSLASYYDPKSYRAHTSSRSRYAPLSSHCLLLVDALHPLLIGTLSNRGARHLLGVKFRQSNSTQEPTCSYLLYHLLRHPFNNAMI